MSRIIKSFTYLLIFTVASMLLTNCNSVFLPKHQKVTFYTDSDENEIYLENELVCKGKSSTVNIDKKNAKGQIVLLRKGYKPDYEVIVRTKRPIAFYSLLILGLPTTSLGLLLDLRNSKCKSFDSEITINSKQNEYLLPERKNDEKFIDIADIRLDIQDKTKDIVVISAKHSDNLLESLKMSEDEFYKKREKLEQKINDKKQKENKGKKLESVEKDLKISESDSKISQDLINTLKKSNFIDTINTVFRDENNTLVLNASIKKITFFLVNNSHTSLNYFKAKLNLTWYIKNTYNELLDSIESIDYSGNFAIKIDHGDFHINNPKYVGDAVLNSFLDLTKKQTFLKHIKLNKDFTIKENILQISKGTDDNKIVNKKDAFKATVIVKAKENNKNVGHGSGFAISKDGYVLTNYHVIAGKTVNKQNEISVITATGQELPAKIVRFNKFRDIALLKIDYTFEKVFYLENKNKAEVMMEVLTIGAPESIELGQSVTTGIISNIRNENENKYLQLGMSINGGNSGGPIFDEQGNLHGIVVSKLVGYATEGVGFAIPSYMVAEYLNLEVK